MLPQCCVLRLLHCATGTSKTCAQSEQAGLTSSALTLSRPSRNAKSAIAKALQRPVFFASTLSKLCHHSTT
eukprot:6177662-Pleurochrysis_carterae.AAC.3